MQTKSEDALNMRGISKSFSGVKALTDVNFSVKTGEIHALVGENGAGKSTLMKILSGVYPASSYEGSIDVFGRTCAFAKPKDAEREGIAIIHQELMVLDDLSIAENIFLGHLHNNGGFVRWKEVQAAAREAIAAVGLDVDVRTRVGKLGIGQKQLVEIAKALSQKSRLLILDEPTAALTLKETDLLFGVLRALRDEQMTIIYISHRMEEVFSLSDRISVLRDGRIIGTRNTAETGYDEIIAMMVGREITDMYPPPGDAAGETLLEAVDFDVFSADEGEKKIVKGASFHVKRGEIVGFSGLLGSGRTELLSAVSGGHTGKSSGKVLKNGQEVSIRSPRDAIRQKIGFITEDRKKTGLILENTVGLNITLPIYHKLAAAGFLNKNKENAIAKEQVEKLSVKTNGIKALVRNLSGGNQQKVIIGKWLTTQPDILVMDEPTRGVDVGAKSEIYRLMRELTNEGVGIVMISSDLQEIIGMSDRVYVMHEGTISGELARNEMTEEVIMTYATGVAAGRSGNNEQ